MDYFSSHCGYVSDRGKECGYWAMEDSPVNLCRDHLYEAYKHARKIITVLAPLSRNTWYRCEKCSGPTVHSSTEAPGVLVCVSCGLEGGPSLFLQKPASRRRQPQGTREHVVYYLQHGDRVKIGTSYNWRERVKLHPHDRVLALEPGSFKREKARHKQFEEYRFGDTEWFAQHDELWDHIIEMNDAHLIYQRDIDSHNEMRRVALRAPSRTAS